MAYNETPTLPSKETHMFRTVLITAKRVRVGDIIEIAGMKYEIESITTFHGTDDIEINFKSSSTIVRYSAYLVNKNQLIKIHSK